MILADFIQGNEDGPHPEHPVLQVGVGDGFTLCLALLLQERAVGDIARFRGDVERSVKLIQALVDELKFVAPARQHVRAQEGDGVTSEGDDDGEDGSILQNAGNR